MRFAELLPFSRKKETPAQREYHFEPIKAIEQESFLLVQALKQAIDDEEYDVLIGDDASGRIPTLILRTIMRDRMEQSHPDWTPEQRRAAIQAYFVAGGRPIIPNASQVWEFLGSVRERSNKKALLVTEYMATGGSVYRLGKIIENTGIPFDIATLRWFKNAPAEYSQDMKEFYGRHRVFKGASVSESVDAPAIYSAPFLAGVRKLSRNDEAGQNPAHAIPSEDRDSVAAAREDIDVMARKIIKEVWKK